MQHNTNLAQQLFTSHVVAMDMNSESITKAKEIFETYKRDEVILSDAFESNIWSCTDEFGYLHFDFNIGTFHYRRFYEVVLCQEKVQVKNDFFLRTCELLTHKFFSHST